MSDEEMLRGCQANEEQAQKFLFEKYSRIMTGVCLRYADSYEEAQDIVQDGFIKVFKKIGMFSGKGSLEGWVRRIVVNTALDQIRKNKKFQKNVEIDDISINLSRESEAEEQLEAESLMQIIQQLPEGYRLVFNMYAIEGYSHKEIAEKLAITESTSKSQYSRAKSTLREVLKKYNIER